MSSLYRAIGFASAVGNAIAFIRGFDGEGLGMIGEFLTSQYAAIMAGSVSLSVAAWAAWPVGVWTYRYPERLRAKRAENALRARTEEKARERAERERVTAELDRVTLPLREFVELMEEQKNRPSTNTSSRHETLPLRRAIANYCHRLTSEAEEAATSHAFNVLRDVDSLGLLPGGIPPFGSAEEARPEHDGLDLDWPREMKRILRRLEAEGLEAARSKVAEWYGHLEPAPAGGTHPAIFQLTGRTVDEIVDGKGRAEHTGEPFRPSLYVPSPRNPSG